MKETAGQFVQAPAAAPVHERVYQALRDKVLFGDLKPGQAVTIQGLAGNLNAGMTPVREAIRRLISDGGLVFQGNRRVSVPVLDQADMEQILFLRLSMEPELTRRAAKRITPETTSLLRDVDAQLDQAIADGDIGKYLALNHRFHEVIYTCAGAEVIAQTISRLWLCFGPSLRVVCGRYGTQNLPDRHKDILAAMERNDADAAAHAMAQDISEGMGQVLQVIGDPA